MTSIDWFGVGLFCGGFLTALVWIVVETALDKVRLPKGIQDAYQWGFRDGNRDMEGMFNEHGMFLDDSDFEE